MAGLIACIDSHNLARVKNIGITEGFPNNNTMRVKCYALLLGCGELDAYDQDGKGTNMLSATTTSTQHSEYKDQIRRDIGRNGYMRWTKTSSYSEVQKQFDLQQIERLIHLVFDEHHEMNYIQSFDSIVALFYLIANGNLYIAQRLFVSYIYMFKYDLVLSANGFGYLSLFWPLLKKYDSKYYQWLKTKTFGGGLGGISVVSEWYTSWYCHCSISSYDLILRIFDFMISTQCEMIGVYMVVSALLLNKRLLMDNVKDEGDLVEFVKHKIVFDAVSVEKLIKKCWKITQNEMKKERKRKVSRYRKIMRLLNVKM